MSTISGLMPLQMVSEIDTKRCVSEKAESRREWTWGVPARTLGSKETWIAGSHIDRRRERMSVRSLGSEGSWIVRSHISWGGERIFFFFIRVWKLLFSRHVLETLRQSPKRTISAIDGFRQLQMVSESDTEQCANEEAEPRRRWTQGGVPVRTLGPERRWIGGPTSIGEGNECQRGL